MRGWIKQRRHSLTPAEDPYIVNADGERFRVRDFVAVTVPMEIGGDHHGQGEIISLVTTPLGGKLAEVKYYPWLSPGFRYGTEYCPANWLTHMDGVDRG